MPKKFITISPPHRHGNPHHLFMDDMLHIQSSLKRVKRYIIYPELDPKGRLHYHGILLLTDSEHVSLYKECRQKLERLGFVDIQPINGIKENMRVIIYITKEWGFTRDVLSIENPIFPPKKRKNIPLKPEECSNRFLDYGFSVSI